MTESAFFWSSALASPTSPSTSGVHLTADRYMCMYRIFSKYLSPTVARKTCHLVTSTIGMNKMTKGDKYLDYRDKTLERTAKPQSVLLGHFLRRNGGFRTHCMDSSQGYDISISS